MELRGDLAIGEAVDHEQGHLGLARGQRRERRTRDDRPVVLDGEHRDERPVVVHRTRRGATLLALYDGPGEAGPATAPA